MGKVFEYIFIGFFVVVGLFVLLVPAGNSKQTGGQQAATILEGAGTGLGTLATDMEGGGVPARKAG